MSRMLLNSSLAREIRYRPKDGPEKVIRAVVCYKTQQSTTMRRTDNSAQYYPVEIIISAEDVPVITFEDDFVCQDITGKERTHRVRAVLTRFRDTVRLGA